MSARRASIERRRVRSIEYYRKYRRAGGVRRLQRAVGAQGRQNNISKKLILVQAEHALLPTTRRAARAAGGARFDGHGGGGRRGRVETYWAE